MVGCCDRALLLPVGFPQSRAPGWLFTAVRRLLIEVASFAAEWRFQACGLQLLSSLAQQLQSSLAQQLQSMGLAAPRHTGSSQTREGARVPWKDPTSCRATKPVCHELSFCSKAWELQLLKPTSSRACALQREATQWEDCAPQERVAPDHHN